MERHSDETTSLSVVIEFDKALFKPSVVIEFVKDVSVKGVIQSVSGLQKITYSSKSYINNNNHYLNTRSCHFNMT